MDFHLPELLVDHEAEGHAGQADEEAAHEERPAGHPHERDRGQVGEDEVGLADVLLREGDRREGEGDDGRERRREPAGAERGGERGGVPGHGGQGLRFFRAVVGRRGRGAADRVVRGRGVAEARGF
jgi:hypothetical protein